MVPSVKKANRSTGKSTSLPVKLIIYQDSGQSPIRSLGQPVAAIAADKH